MADPTPAPKLGTVTVLLIFLIIVLFEIFLVLVLIIFIRKIKALLRSQTKPYFYIVLIYIIAKLAVCIILQLRIISGIPNQFDDLSGDYIELCFKNSLLIGDLCLIELFLISFELYMSICFAFLQLRIIGRNFRFAIRSLQVVVFLMYMILVILYNLNLIPYQVNNDVGAALNGLSILAFITSFFFLNFKMTGIMIQASLNQSMKRIYKVILVLMFSRAVMGAFEVVIAVMIRDGSFSGFIETFASKSSEQVVFAALFVAYILFTLITEGIPLMISLRTPVVLAFNAQFDRNFDKQSMLTLNSSVLNQALIDSMSMNDEPLEVDDRIELKTFKIIEVIKEEAIQKLMKAKISERVYIIRQINADISNYIIEDIENEIKEIEGYNIKPLNKMSFFCENNSVYIYERYRPQTLDSMIQKASSIEEQIKLGIRLALAIEMFHRKEITHGCLNQNNVAFDSGENMYFLGFGLESLKKYLSLTSDYTNKTFYTAVQVLNDRHNVILRPTKAADVYSFGMLFYEIVTKNFNYRTLSLKEVKSKFVSENFRPKIPDQVDGNIKNLMRKCWQENPSERPTIGYVIDFMTRLIR